MGARILVIEDDKDIRRNLRKLLESEGYKVDLAVNGLAALEVLSAASELPCLIFLDLMMPVMDGIQFRAVQAKDPRLSQVPVVIMSAHGQLEETRAKLGLLTALRKPVDVDAILSVVSEICGCCELQD